MRARAAAEALDWLSQGVTLGDMTIAELRCHEDEDAAGREAYLAHGLPAEWVAELEKPIPPYETELDHLMESGDGRGAV